jgi:hypothetical protein
MAPWTAAAQPNGEFLLKWVSDSGNNSLFGGLDSIGKGYYSHGHDDLQVLALTWGHKFNDRFHTLTESYYIWERNARRGGTVTYGPPQPFFEAVGPGERLPGLSDSFGIVNYTAYMTRRSPTSSSVVTASTTPGASARGSRARTSSTPSGSSTTSPLGAPADPKSASITPAVRRRSITGPGESNSRSTGYHRPLLTGSLMGPEVSNPSARARAPAEISHATRSVSELSPLDTHPSVRIPAGALAHAGPSHACAVWCGQLSCLSRVS